MTAGQLLREARLRAGLTQEELAKQVGGPRSQIARWEQDAVEPGFETVRRLLRACGFDLPLELVPYEPAVSERLGKNVLLAPERRVRRMLRALTRRRDTGTG
jgi:transcriptional regulator with XRE-family HTH domain